MADPDVVKLKETVDRLKAHGFEFRWDGTVKPPFLFSLAANDAADLKYLQHVWSFEVV